MKYSDKDNLVKMVYMDNHLLVLNKPAGLLTQSDGSLSANLEDLAKSYLQKILNKETVFLQVVHRLDKSVSGLILFARSSKALSRLNEEIRNKNIKKKYLALVEGKVTKEKDHLIHYHLHKEFRAEIFVNERENTKKAELEYRVLKSWEDCTLLDIDLISGRYHQIRAQLSFIGHPIIGDKKYSSKKNKECIKLHSYYLELSHPILKNRIYFLSTFPHLQSESFIE